MPERSLQRVEQAKTPWIRREGRPNLFLSADDFYISYNPTARADNFSAIFAPLIQAPAEATEETALFSKADRIWRILEGDFREEYETAFSSGLAACIAVYDRHKANHRSGWSTD